MLTPFFYLYFTLLLSGILFAGLAYRLGEKRFMLMLILFAATLLFEILQLVLVHCQITCLDFLYNLFSCNEYALFCFFIMRTFTRTSVERMVAGSVFLFGIVSLAAAGLVVSGNQNFNWVAWNINLEGFLLFMIYAYALFNIDDKVPLPIYRHPDFWIAVGILIFHGGVFVVMGLYPVLLHIDPGAAAAAYGSIMKPLNIILYLCIIGGCINCITNRKYLIRSN